MRLTRTEAVLVGLALLVALNIVWPRYDWRDPGGDDPTAFIRVDRWTGRADLGYFIHVEGRRVGTWLSHDDIWREQNAGAIVRPSSETLRSQAVELGRRRRDVYGGTR